MEVNANVYLKNSNRFIIFIIHIDDYIIISSKCLFIQANKDILQNNFELRNNKNIYNTIGNVIMKNIERKLKNFISTKIPDFWT